LSAWPANASGASGDSKPGCFSGTSPASRSELNQAGSSAMWVRVQIAAMVYLMVQAVMFGAGVVLVLATPLADSAMTLMPWVVATTAVLSIPISWMIAPRLRARYWRERGLKSDITSGPNFESPF
jgi:flagellar biosynthesis protein FliQ